MKNFAFNLEKLLKIRQYKEREWEVKFGQAVRDCMKIEKHIEQNKLEIDRMIKTGSEKILDQEYLLSKDIYRRRLENEISQSKINLKKAEQQREKIKVEYLEHSRKRKILSKLKEKRQEEYLKNQLKIEFNEMDEMNNARNFF